MSNALNVMNRNKLQLKDKVIIGCMLFSGFASFLPDSVNTVALYVVIPFAFLLSFFLDNRRFDNHTFRIFLILFFWLVMSTLWAAYFDLAMAQNKQLLGTVLVSYIVGKNAYNTKMIPWMYAIWIALYISVIYYAYSHIIPNITIGMQRLNDSKLNANMIGYYTFYLTFVIYILGEITQKPIVSLCFKFLFIGMLFVSYFAAYITASRQILLIQVPLLLFLLYGRYMKKVRARVKLIFLILCVPIIFILKGLIMQTYDDSLLQRRNQIEISEDSRALLAKDAFRVGMDHFFLGVGNGNYAKYSYSQDFSHNSYLELFANTGIIGLSIYLYLLISYLKVQCWRYKVTKDKMFLNFIIFFIIFCFYNIFYVFYPYPWLFAFFILVSSHSDAYFKEIYYNRLENEDRRTASS